VVSGLEPKFLIPTVDQNEEQPQSRIINMSEIIPKTKLIILLEKGQYAEAMEHLKSQSASGVDIELKTISLENGGKDLQLVIDFLVNRLESGKDFGHVQAYVKVVLKVGHLLEQKIRDHSAVPNLAH